MRRLLAYICLALLCSAISAQAEEDIRTFALNTLLQSSALSPNGDRLAVTSRDEYGTIGVITYAITPDGLEKVGETGFDKLVNSMWIEWLDNDEMLVGLSYNDTLISTAGSIHRRHNGAITRGYIAKRKYEDLAGTIVTRSRLLRVNFEANRVFLVEPNGGISEDDQIGDDVVHMLPTEPGRILLAFGDASKKSLLRLSPGRPIQRTLATGRDGIQNWITDPMGNVRVGWGYDEDGDLVFHKQSSEDKKLKNKSKDAKRLGYIVPLGVGDQTDTLYVAARGNNDYLGLYTLDLNSMKLGDEIFGADGTDISSLIWNFDRTQVIGLQYADDRRRTVFLEENFQSHWDKIRQRFDTTTVVSFEGLTRDSTRVLIRVSDPQNPGDLYLYNTQTQNLQNLGAVWPEMKKMELGHVISTQYSAQDGTVIPAFITLPPSISTLDNVRNIPFVVLPHGGPRTRDYLEFDPIAQFIAHQGYGVLQMNFRGSSGYGASFEDAATKNWGGLLQTDIHDGTAWLKTKGYADSEKICIVGWSFGGYAALQNAKMFNTDYRCAASIAGVTDLRELIRHSDAFYGGKSSLEDYIGHLWSDRQMLKQQSPALNADGIQSPVLLVHGRRDAIVPVEQSQSMRRALTAAGNPPRYKEIEKGNHSLDDYESRYAVLVELKRFLNEHLKK